MSRKILLIALAAASGTAVYFVASRVPQPVPDPAVQSNQTVSSSTQILALVDLFSGDSINQQSILASSPTQTKVTFEELTDESHRGRNPFYEIHINGESIGEAGGYLLAPTFSPDNRYLAFRSMWISGCAGTCFGSGIYVVNLVDKTMVQIPSPRKTTDYSGPSTVLEINNAVVEPYGWDGNIMKIVFYYSGYSYPREDTYALCTDGIDNERDGATDLIDDDCMAFRGPEFRSATTSQSPALVIPFGKHYRLSPKELWRYDLNAKQYTFLGTLPE